MPLSIPTSRVCPDRRSPNLGASERGQKGPCLFMKNARDSTALLIPRRPARQSTPSHAWRVRPVSPYPLPPPLYLEMDPRSQVHAGAGFGRRAFLIGPGGQATLAPPTNPPDLTLGDSPTIVDGGDSTLPQTSDSNEGQRPPTIPPQVPLNFHSVANEAPTQIASTATQGVPSMPLRPGTLGMAATPTAVAGTSSSVSSLVLPGIFRGSDRQGSRQQLFHQSFPLLEFRLRLPESPKPP